MRSRYVGGTRYAAAAVTACVEQKKRSFGSIRDPDAWCLPKNLRSRVWLACSCRQISLRGVLQQYISTRVTCFLGRNQETKRRVNEARPDRQPDALVWNYNNAPILYIYFEVYIYLYLARLFWDTDWTGPGHTRSVVRTVFPPRLAPGVHCCSCRRGGG